MRENSRPRPLSIPNPTRAAFPELHQTHTADDYMEEPRKETITDAQLPLTANPLPPGGANQEMDKRAKKVSNVIQCVHEDKAAV